VAAPVALTIDTVADEYLVHNLHTAIVSHGESAKIADIARAIDDESISMGLIRHTLVRNPQRFISIDRRWDINTRYLDKQRPAQRLLEEIVANYSAPITAWDAAHEFAMVSGRTPEGVLATVEKMFRGSGRFGELNVNGSSRYVPFTWLLDTSDDYTKDADVLFYNFLSEEAIAPYTKLKLDWENDPIGAVEQLLAHSAKKTPRVIDNRIVQYLAWKALGEDFDAAGLYGALVASDRVVVLSEHRWTDPETAQTLRNLFVERAQALADVPEEEEAEAEEATPLNVSDEDLVEFEHILQDAGERAVRSSIFLQEVFEIGAGDRTFANDIQTVTDALQARTDRFEWVGYDRFRVPGTLPPYIGQMPENLTFPIVPQIETPEGDLLDQLMEDEGFERGLEREVLSSVAQDVNDQEPSESTVWPEGVSADSATIDLVLKAHHKEIGTFPLCQIPLGFLAVEPNIVEIVLRDRNGVTYQAFADYDTQLLYGLGLFDLYSDIAADSGAIVRLEKTGIAGEFTFINTGETHPEVYVSPERMEQLQNYRATEVEAGPTVASFDIVKYVLEHSNAAMSFLALLTEVNIVRRISRRQLASILSGWSGFSHRSGVWTYDHKKAAQGYNKAKRKYTI
jgi:hypothetical protein